MNPLALTLVFPLLGFTLLAFAGARLSERRVALIGVGSIGLAALTALLVGWRFLAASEPGASQVQTLWAWLAVEGFRASVSLHLDGLSLTLLGVVTGVGFLIHLFASWYMRGQEGYGRFFAYMNLFVASMLLLVLGDNLLLLYFGWEGVGLCSYLLIGFYYRTPANGAAALKAFIVTRIGDVLMLLGLFILYYAFATLNIQEMLARAPQQFASGDPMLTLATLLLLGGAVGKSAQLPLQTWLADAMAGPTPVSALIHAATMVTAGVYLIARCHGLFSLTPLSLELVGLVGALTLLLAGCAALVQTDIKRILAYSTMSQIGYMFLALGVGAWQAAIFHLMTHAFFKALLFLTAGAVIDACHHEQNIFKMGGLRRALPLAYACFLVGGSALAALPLVSAGFYSKDEILWEAFASGYPSLLLAGLVGAVLTAFYTFRLIFVAFHGPAQIQAKPGQGIAHWLPLVTLLLLSTFIGALIEPPLAGVLPEGAGHAGGAAKLNLELLSGTLALISIGLAALLFLRHRDLLRRLAVSASGRFFGAWWRAAWGFDWLYERLFVRPYLGLCRLLAGDPFDRSIGLLPRLARWLHLGLSRTQSGQIRWYALTLAGGAVLLLAVLKGA